MEVVACFGETIVDVTQLVAERGYRIGSAPGVDLALGDVVGASFPLIAARNGGFVFHRALGIDGDLTIDGRSTALSALGQRSGGIAKAFEIPIPPRARIRARIGAVDFVITQVATSARIPRAVRGDRRALGYLVLSLAAHMFLWAMASDKPDEPAPTVLLERVWGVDPEIEIEEREAVRIFDDDKSPDYATRGGGAPLEVAVGAAGSLTSPHKAGHIQIQQRDDKPGITRAQAIEDARTAGILGSRAITTDTFAGVVGTKDLSSGFDSADIYGPLFGGVGDARGNFGLGRSGNFTSAGCADGACGIIGVGRYGTLSNGTSVGDGWGGHGAGAGSLPGRFGRRKPRVPTVTFCSGPTPCVATGGLDKAIVRRYIKRNLEKITYCYEKELLARPALSGEVIVDFLIAPDGTVQSASSTGDAAIATCLSGVVHAIQFPRSVEQTATQVRYPFMFRHE